MEEEEKDGSRLHRRREILHFVDFALKFPFPSEQKVVNPCSSAGNFLFLPILFLPSDEGFFSFCDILSNANLCFFLNHILPHFIFLLSSAVQFMFAKMQILLRKQGLHNKRPSKNHEQSTFLYLTLLAAMCMTCSRGLERTEYADWRQQAEVTRFDVLCVQFCLHSTVT